MLYFTSNLIDPYPPTSYTIIPMQKIERNHGDYYIYWVISSMQSYHMICAMYIDRERDFAGCPRRMISFFQTIYYAYVIIRSMLCKKKSFFPEAPQFCYLR